MDRDDTARPVARLAVFGHVINSGVAWVAIYSQQSCPTAL